MRVIVCGGRDYDDEEHVEDCLDQLLTMPKPLTFLITGGAPGADSLAEAWAKKRGVPSKVFPADWDAHGRAAGPLRNKQMLDEGKGEMVVAFPGGRGTMNMVKQAEGRVPIIKISRRVKTEEKS